MRGVVIQSYGAGNGPDSRRDLMELFREASARGLLILNITQCQRGAVTTSYATGKVTICVHFHDATGKVSPEDATLSVRLCSCRGASETPERTLSCRHRERKIDAACGVIFS